MKKILGFIIVLSLVFQSCDDKEQTATGLKGFSNEVLANWAENIIYPSFTNYQVKARALTKASADFEMSATDANFTALKENWLEAYKAYQKTIIFDVYAIESGDYIVLSNSYPTTLTGTIEISGKNVALGIEENIELVKAGKGSEISLSRDIITPFYSYQGFPALDYLLHTKDLTYFESNKSARTYMRMLTEALESHVNKAVTFWETNKQNVANSTDQSITGAYSRIVNSFVRIYESRIRAEKVGYACGAIPVQNGVGLPKNIEAYYNPDPKVSKELLRIALQSSQDFFNGKHFGSNKEGKSLKSTLVELGRNQLVKGIQDQYKEAFNELDKIPETKSLRDLASEGMSVADYTKRPLYPLFLAMQKNVGNLKRRMLTEALNVQINYVDGDGD